MDSNIFSVSDYYELLAMQRVFREAKFSLCPSDDEITGSPIVSKLFARLIEAIVSTEAQMRGDTAKERWVQWLTIDESREEWGIALQRAKSNRDWASWTESKRREYVHDLLSPFIVDDALLTRFIDSVRQG